jgi:hypothetical protein
MFGNTGGDAEEQPRRAVPEPALGLRAQRFVTSHFMAYFSTWIAGFAVYGVIACGFIDLVLGGALEDSIGDSGNALVTLLGTVSNFALYFTMYRRLTRFADLVIHYKDALERTRALALAWALAVPRASATLRARAWDIACGLPWVVYGRLFEGVRWGVPQVQHGLSGAHGRPIDELIGDEVNSVLRELHSADSEGDDILRSAHIVSAQLARDLDGAGTKEFTALFEQTERLAVDSTSDALRFPHMVVEGVLWTFYAIMPFLLWGRYGWSTAFVYPIAMLPFGGLVIVLHYLGNPFRPWLPTRPPFLRVYHLWPAQFETYIENTFRVNGYAGPRSGVSGVGVK